MILICLSWGICRYHQLCRSTYFVTGVENKKRVVRMGPVVDELGAAKAEALPSFHAFSGADITSRFAGKGKLTCWQALSRCSIEIILAFAPLGTSEELRVETECAIDTFVCQLYEPCTTVLDVGDLKWKLFNKKQLEAQKLPPTRRASHESISWAHYQAMVSYGIRRTFLTLSYHQRQTRGGRKRAIDSSASPKKGSPSHSYSPHQL